MFSKHWLLVSSRSLTQGQMSSQEQQKRSTTFRSTHNISKDTSFPYWTKPHQSQINQHQEQFPKTVFISNVRPYARWAHLSRRHRPEALSVDPVGVEQPPLFPLRLRQGVVDKHPLQRTERRGVVGGGAEGGRQDVTVVVRDVQAERRTEHVRLDGGEQRAPHQPRLDVGLGRVEEVSDEKQGLVVI